MSVLARAARASQGQPGGTDILPAVPAATVHAQQAAGGAASWAARSYLGLGGLAEGAPADAVIYDADPRRDLSQLAAPRAVILRGQVRYRRS